MIAPNPSGVCTVSTPLGWMAAVGTGDELHLLKIGHRSERDALTAAFAEWGEPLDARWRPDALIDQLRRYAAGEPVDFSDVQLDLERLTPFQRRVVAGCHAIGYGQTLSYAALAAQAGSPRAARAVGNVMRANRHPLVIPCHRVVGAAGRLGGFSAPQGVEFKRRLLAMEAEACGRGAMV